MDILKKITEFVSIYRYALLVLVIGLVLMLLPTGTDTPQEPEATEAAAEHSRDISQELTQILGMIRGVGKVQVMLTVEEGEMTIYQFDESTSSKDTVIMTDQNRAESALVQQVLPQKFRGAIVVCQGADSASVRLSVIEAVSKVTGLSSDRISVLKMK